MSEYSLVCVAWSKKSGIIELKGKNYCKLAADQVGTVERARAKESPSLNRGRECIMHGA